MLKQIISYLPNIHKEGYLFIFLFIVLTAIFFYFSKTLGMIGVILTVWCVCFFRDPDRCVPDVPNVVVSPADGLVDAITKVRAPSELDMGDGEWTRVSIFLSVFDVHVNRIPVSGVVKKLHYHPGQFISATLDKASDLNERQSVYIESTDGHKLAVVQIAGLIARRIVCSLDENIPVEAGARFGIIRFGSRVDVYLPAGIEPNVYLGQRMVGGETVIAMLSGPQKQHITGKRI